MVSVTYKVKEMRLKKRMSLRQLEAASGVSRSQISKIENYKTEPTLYCLALLAMGLGCRLEELYEYEIE